MPNCNIIVYDNESDDSSVEIAQSLGCHIISWSSNNIQDENLQVTIRNTCWKSIQSGWIIMADMDEWVCITEDMLELERRKGTTILQLRGLNMVGTSETMDLSDTDLSTIQQFVEHPPESKKLCFLREKITDMRYGPGSHTCDPRGSIRYSSTIYNNKHMHYMGLPYLINKMVRRYERNAMMRTLGLNTHYTDDTKKITDDYTNALKISQKLEI